MSDNTLKKRDSAFDKEFWSDDERDYVEYVNDTMRERYKLPFHNHGTFHAVHLIYRFFIGAAKEVRIFSGELKCYADSDDGYRGMKIYAEENILHAVGAFLFFEGTSLKIVVERLDDVLNHPLVLYLQKLKARGKLAGRCDIVQLDVDEYDRDQHMIILDRSAYRMETDSEKVKALVSANDPPIAKRLIKVFDKLWANSKPLWSSESAGR